MTLKQLAFAQALARKKSFSGAAAFCHVSQPSLSNAIAALEVELGGRLYHRTTRSVSLTPLGESLVPLIEDVLATADHLKAAADASRNTQVHLIRIGLSPLVSTPLLAEVLRPFERQHRALKIVLKQCFLGDLRERMGSHTLDLAVVPAGFFKREYQRCAFYQDSLQFLPADGTAGSDRPPAKPVTLREVARESFIMSPDGCGLASFVRHLFRSERVPLKEYPGVALNHQVIEEWVGLGIGAGLLPKLKLTAQKLRAQPVLLRTGKPAMLGYELAWHERSPAGSHVLELIRHFQTVVPKLLAGRVEDSISPERRKNVPSRPLLPAIPEG